MKTLFFNLLTNFYKKNWSKKNKIHILIQTSHYFNKNSWENSLKTHFPFYQNSEIIYVKNRYEIPSLLANANFAFLWGLSRYINLNDSNLKLIYFGTSGIEFTLRRNIPSDIIIERPEAIASEAIAEYSLATALMTNRKLHIALHNQCKRKWEQKSLISEKYTPLKNKTIGIIGIGNNGRIIAKYFNNFGCKIYALDKANIKDNNVEKYFSIQELDLFLSEINVLILSVPLNKETKFLINKRTLSYLKKGSIIINTSRSGIIHEDDMLKAIKKKNVQYAVIDVFNNEPLGFFDSRWKNPGLIITPHIAGNINLFVDEIQMDFCKKLNKNYR